MFLLQVSDKMLPCGKQRPVWIIIFFNTSQWNLHCPHKTSSLLRVFFLLLSLPPPSPQGFCSAPGPAGWLPSGTRPFLSKRLSAILSPAAVSTAWALAQPHAAHSEPSSAAPSHIQRAGYHRVFFPAGRLGLAPAGTSPGAGSEMVDRMHGPAQRCSKVTQTHQKHRGRGVPLAPPIPRFT